MTNTLSRRVTERKGSAAVVFALSVPMVALTLGAAVDFSRMASVRAAAQNALDTTTLAKAANPTEITDAKAETMFNQNFVVPTAVVTGPTFSIGTDGIVNGSVSASLPTTFLGIAGLSTVSIKATSKAHQASAPKMSSATMKTTAAAGAFDKQIYLVTYDKDKAVISRTLMLTYDYTLKNGNGTKVYTPAIGATATVNVTSYDQAAIEMVVYQDLTYTGKRTNAVSYFSNASNASTFIKITGACSDTGGAALAWEDGGDSNFADFKNTMTCTVATGTADVVRLTQ